MTSIRLITNIDWLFPELSDVVRMFVGDVPISAEAGETELTHIHAEEADGWLETALGGGIKRCVRAAAVKDGLERRRMLKRAAKSALFELLREMSGINPPWGSLTGIRPTRLMYEALERGMDEKQAAEWLRRSFYVEDEKLSLLGDILKMQRGLITPPEDSFDMYIGIPFCVTRCAYCSFSSGEIGDGRLTQPYVAALKREMRGGAGMMNALGLRLRAGYVGGGTPTSLSCAQLDELLDSALELFPGGVEWTVEAGRPDTIDRAKLKMLKSHGVKRISINPQSFSDETLRAIGRAHSARDTLNAYYMAREEGFDDINMDLIAALPGEGRAEFANSLDRVIALAPESVTVHCLAIKRSSRLHEQMTVSGGAHNQASAPDAEEMIRSARKKLSAGGWQPYYLYRQKYMAGNLENVGYAKPGYACLYNIGNMEETARVLALGAGAITKWIFRRELRIERAPNLRNIEQYIERVDEMIARKAAVILGTPTGGMK